ncbi:MAG: DUF294 nucleotidyltransferase-like domain-containing protein [Bacteroidota bacterium]
MTHRVRAVFTDPARADRNLKALADACIASGTRVSGEELVAAVEARLRESPDPDQALTNLVRFSEESLNKAALFNDLVAYPVLLDVLVKLFAFSAYFADILVRDPELFRWLTASDSLLKSRTQEYYDSEVRRSFETFQKPDRRLNALRRFARREILRIGARDILGEANLVTITRELSLLADALINASCEVGEQQLSEQFPAKPDVPYAIIGLGKLGGCELNYSSDIDLLFVYENEGELEDARGKRATYHEYFNKLCEKMVQNLSTGTNEGHLYRVDMRLRPESGAGPLARSMNSYMLYYESRGELWERQMLIKARTVGGKKELGDTFIRQLEPFVYPRTFFERPEESIARIKARIESAIEGEENVKLRAGGIRDIEFIVQALQLINGGKLKSIRGNNTLDAIRSLSAERLLNEKEAVTLTEAYIFLRTIEHRLQMTMNTQTHKLPDDQHALSSLAKRIGLESSTKLVENYARHLKDVKKIFDQVLSVRSETKTDDLAAIVEGGLSDTAMKQVLGVHGFQSPVRAVQHLKSLTRGSLLTERQDLDGRSRQAFREAAPAVFADISRTPSPDLTLQNLAHLASAQRLPDVFYRQMKEPGFRNLVLKLCSVSPRIIKGLALQPGLFEEITSGVEALSVQPSHKIKARTDIVEYRITHELRASVRYVLGLTTFTEFTAELSSLADALFDHILRVETKSFGLKSVPLAVFALGKYGTREISLDADLDILLLVETKSAAEKNKMEKLAQRITTRLSASSEKGKGYDIDARLRPEGRSAPLVVETSAFHQYLNDRASLWERQSMTRLRFVCGNKKISERLLDGVKKFAYESPLPQNWVEDIVAMRRKMETRSRTRGSDHVDIKLGAGGMVDVEFLVQMSMLASGQLGRRLHGMPTMTALEEIPWLAKDDRKIISSAYALYRKLELYKRLALEEHGSLLPEGEHLDMLGRIHDGSSGQQMKASIEKAMQTVRKIFLTTADNLKDKAGS